LTGTGHGLGEKFLAREGCVASPPAIRVAAYIPVGVPHVVFVLFVELVVGHQLEASAPKHNAFFEAEADAFEKERVLQATKVFEVGVATEGLVEVLHAEGEVLGEGVDGAGGDGGEAVDVSV
jgi:hypothetical protein